MSYGILDQMVTEHRSELSRAASEQARGRRVLAARRLGAHKSLGQELGSFLIRAGNRLAPQEARHSHLGAAAR